MDISIIFNAVSDFIAELSGKVIVKVGTMSISLYGWFFSFLLCLICQFCEISCFSRTRKSENTFNTHIFTLLIILPIPSIPVIITMKAPQNAISY